MTKEGTERQIVISKNGEWQTVFKAPADTYAARELWVFLVDNLRPGFIVELCNGPSEITRPSGQPVPIELYRKLMDMDLE